LPSIVWPKDNAEEAVPVVNSERVMNTSKKRSSSCRIDPKVTDQAKDEFDDDSMDEDELFAALNSAEKPEFRDIDTFESPGQAESTTRRSSAKTSGISNSKAMEKDSASKWQPVKMDNGRWECNHKCKDKHSCKHICCREGLDKPPKAPKQNTGVKGKEDMDASANENKSKLPRGQTTLAMGRSTQRAKVPSMEDDIELLDLSRSKGAAKPKAPKAEEYQRLDKLHASTQNTRAPSAASLTRPARTHSNRFRTSQHLSFLPQHMQLQEEEELGDESTDYGAGISDFELPDEPVRPQKRFENDAAMVAQFTGNDKVVPPTTTATSTTHGYSESDGLLEEAMVGLADSQNMQRRGPECPVNEVDEPMEEVTHAKPTKLTGIRAPFFKTSSPVVVEVATRAKRQVSTQHETEKPAPKKPRTAGIEQSAALTKEKPEGEDESSEPPSEIDPMILQMFGSYVDFV
jgi:ATP-dependent DNA helicase HFM1/MER3